MSMSPPCPPCPPSTAWLARGCSLPTCRRRRRPHCHVARHGRARGLGPRRWPASVLAHLSAAAEGFCAVSPSAHEQPSDQRGRREAKACGWRRAARCMPVPLVRPVGTSRLTVECRSLIVPLRTRTLRDRPPCLSPLCVAACQAPPNANLQRPAQRVLPPASASVPCAAAPMLTRGIAAPWGSTTDLARRSTTDQSISTRATSTQVQVAACRQAFKMPSTSFLQVKTVKTVKQEPYAPSSTTAPENSSVYKLVFDILTSGTDFSFSPARKELRLPFLCPALTCRSHVFDVLRCFPLLL